MTRTTEDLSVSVVIPCFNEEEVLPASYPRVKKVLESLNPGHYEIIFINNGSLDRTAEILSGFARQDKHVRVIHLSRNFGHQAAVTAGLNHCTGDAAIIMDADLQDPPEVIPDMVNQYLEKGCHVLYGVRIHRKGESLFKKSTAWLFYRFMNLLSDVPFPVDTGDFRLIDRKVIQVFKSLPEKNKYIRGLIGWMGFRQLPFPYIREPRFAGETKYPFRKMVHFAAIGLFYFSKKPLKIATTIGFLSTMIGLGLLIWVFVAILSGSNELVAGWASTIFVVIFFGGVQLLTIGVLGQYIGSLFDEVKGRPEFIIDYTENFPA